KKTVLSVISRAGISSYQLSEIAANERFSYGLKIHRGSVVLAEFGEVKKSVCQTMGIKSTVFYAEIFFETLINWVSKEKVEVKEISKFPVVSRDLALIVDKKVTFADIETIAKQTEKQMLKQVTLFDVYENEQTLGLDKKSYAVSFLFENNKKTLQDKEVDEVMDRMSHHLEDKIGALIRK
ncbi:MAG: phenylalanine--tRNA ligase subunit beta, partial [Saprospiraceae bacterium]